MRAPTPEPVRLAVAPPAAPLVADRVVGLAAADAGLDPLAVDQDHAKPALDSRRSAFSSSVWRAIRAPHHLAAK